jgi:hypothetical protein
MFPSCRVRVAAYVTGHQLPFWGVLWFPYLQLKSEMPLALSDLLELFSTLTGPQYQSDTSPPLRPKRRPLFGQRLRPCRPSFCLQINREAS